MKHKSIFGKPSRAFILALRRNVIMKKIMIPAVLMVTALTITPVFSSCADTLTDHELTLGTYPTVPAANDILQNEILANSGSPDMSQTAFGPTGTSEDTKTEEELIMEQQNKAWLEEQERLQAEALHALQIGEFYKDSVLIGDSVAEGFSLYAARNATSPIFQNLKFLTRVSYSVHNAFMAISGKSKHPIYHGEQMYAWDSLKLMGAKHIYTFFGLNDLWAGADNTVAKYIQYIARIQQEIPGIKITIVSTTPMYKSAKEEFTNATILEFNKKMSALAAENGWGYLDVASRLYDSDGNLAQQYCSDHGVHQTFAAYRLWQAAFEEYAEAHLEDTQSDT
jgi:lysophospholipase L1-like esterase